MEAETREDVQRRIEGLIDTTWAYSALVTAAETGLLAALESPRSVDELTDVVGVTSALARGLLDVLLSLGLVRRDGERYVTTPGLDSFLGGAQMDEILPWLKSQHLQAREMVDAARLGRLQPGWTHVDPELLQAQGRTGRRSTRAMATHLFPTLQGLQARLESPDAAFLDVGMGVGIISIEMCSIYPKLRAVGLEPGEVQGAEARRNIAEAGLENRIEIRTQGLQDLADREAFDLAFVPQVFIPTTVVRPGLQNVWSALRPGGWVMMIAFDAPGDDLHATTTRLLNVLWGGDPLSLEEVAGMAREAGFEMVQVAGEPGNLIKVVVGRRPL